MGFCVVHINAVLLLLIFGNSSAFHLLDVDWVIYVDRDVCSWVDKAGVVHRNTFPIRWRAAESKYSTSEQDEGKIYSALLGDVHENIILNR